MQGYDPTPWNGFTDFCLYRPDGTILAVVEAKRTARNAREGEEQLRQYVTEISGKQDVPPFGFMTNGLHHYFWEVGLAHPRPIAGFFSPDRWLDELTTDAKATMESIARREGCSVRKVNMAISLAFLAPARARHRRLESRTFGLADDYRHQSDLPLPTCRQIPASINRSDFLLNNHTVELCLSNQSPVAGKRNFPAETKVPERLPKTSGTIAERLPRQRSRRSVRLCRELGNLRQPESAWWARGGVPTCSNLNDLFCRTAEKTHFDGKREISDLSKSVGAQRAIIFPVGALR